MYLFQTSELLLQIRISDKKKTTRKGGICIKRSRFMHTSFTLYPYSIAIVTSQEVAIDSEYIDVEYIYRFINV